MAEPLPDLTPIPNDDEQKETRKGLLHRILHGHLAGNFFALIFVFLSIYGYAVLGVRTFHVPSASMEPTLVEGDQLITVRQEAYTRGDVVVMHDREHGDYIVKRIVGIEGDTLQVKGGALYINNAYASEPYIKEAINYDFPDPGFATVPPGEIFYLGDNRNNSEDSSINLKTKPLQDIVGTLKFIYYPYNRFGPVPAYPLNNTKSP